MDSTWRVNGSWWAGRLELAFCIFTQALDGHFGIKNTIHFLEQPPEVVFGSMRFTNSFLGFDIC